jgi:hypothetical protein
MSGSDHINDFGAFQPGRGTTIKAYEFRRWDSHRFLGQIAVYDCESGENEPVAYAPGSIRTELEAEIWLEGFQAGFQQGVTAGRHNLQCELSELLRPR